MDYATAGYNPAKVLIDERLSPKLVTLARERGFVASTHATWMGLHGKADWSLVDYAVEHDYVLVTNNCTDFIPLVMRQAHHPGLICINFAHGLSSRDAQRRLLAKALDEIDAAHLPDSVHDVTLEADTTVRITSPAFP